MATYYVVHYLTNAFIRYVIDFRANGVMNNYHIGYQKEGES